MTIENSINAGKRNGIALLSVLILIVAITIISLAFISRSDSELACGRNAKLHTQVDYLAESGLAHAKSLILNPQNVAVETGRYWTGDVGQQLESGNVYYDIMVRRHETGPTALCSFDVTCSAYSISNGERAASTTLAAELRLDPCIALWVGGNANLGTATFVNGDIYCGGSLTAWRPVEGDIYAGGTIWASSSGQEHTPSPSPVQWPQVRAEDLCPSYYIAGATYAAQSIDVSPLTGYSASPSSINPAGIVYYIGDLEINGPITIDGTLIVTGNLTINGPANRITAQKNYPAFIVGGSVIVGSNSSITINGLAVVEQQINIPATSTDVSFVVSGGLFVAQTAVLAPGAGSTVLITADHSRTALLTWGPSNQPYVWRQAGGAFFKDIRRQP